MPPRVFCRKSAEVIENKGRESRKERKERSRVRNRKEAKEIEEVKGVEGENSARFVRDNTRNGTIDPVYFVNSKLKFKGLNGVEGNSRSALLANEQRARRAAKRRRPTCNLDTWGTQIHSRG